MKEYKGIVDDREEKLMPRSTKWYTNFNQCYKATLALCERTYGERGSLRFVDRRGNLYTPNGKRVDDI